MSCNSGRVHKRRSITSTWVRWIAEEAMEMLRQEKGVGAYGLSDILLYSDWLGTLLNIGTSLVTLEGYTEVPV